MKITGTDIARPHQPEFCQNCDEGYADHWSDEAGQWLCDECFDAVEAAE